tara:strand:- start:41121 stop:41354 length:234 start_codon:yes stop_codon:yes gene_type:complete
LRPLICLLYLSVLGAKVVLPGEASHGTAEFYTMRDRITRELIEHKGFNFIAVEADWPERFYAAIAEEGVPDTSPFGL